MHKIKNLKNLILRLQKNKDSISFFLFGIPVYKQIKENGHFKIHILGIKILSMLYGKYNQIWKRRFQGLSEAEKIYVIKEQFKKRLGYELNLNNPQTYNEKIQWIKLYYHNPLMTKCADKVAVREYIKEKIGADYLIPCLGIWDKAEDIDFTKLPNQFVLKVNWGSGQNIIVKDKSKLNIKKTLKQLKKWMKPESNHYYYGLEWVYKNIRPKIIAEKYISQFKDKLNDYKFFCFNGKAYYCQVDVDRFTNHKRCFYDLSWIKQPFTENYPLYEKEITKPTQFKKMQEISEKLASDFPHVRVDLYLINNRIKFGELTFSNENGMGPFSPVEWDYKFGRLFKLPKHKITNE